MNESGLVPLMRTYEGIADPERFFTRSDDRANESFGNDLGRLSLSRNPKKTKTAIKTQRTSSIS